MQSFKWLVGACLGAFAGSIAAAGPASPAATELIERLKVTLAERLPTVRVLQIRPAQIEGIYEVIAPDGMLYVDASGDHMLTGEIVDTRTHRNLSREDWDALNAVDFDSLPFELAIRTVHGDGSRRVAVFADPHCPYCRQLEGELRQEDNLTVYTFLFPLEDVHPGATGTAHELWCAPDRAGSWSRWMLEQQTPPSPSSACSKDPVSELARLGARLHINMTPTILFPSGRRSAGLPKHEDLERLLSTETTAPANQPTHGGG
jgi:thiol:disulfide interchange protein DsbC